jgi:type II secretory pathway pseudopilin PulG
VQRGFTYLVLLLWLAIGSALLTALASRWSFEARRERETEFVFRAEQYRSAIESYAAPININGCANVQRLPASLDDLLTDPRCGLMRHHLRTLYLDPITRSPEWGLVQRFGAIEGVYSRSDRAPLRHINGVRTYQDWKFVANAADGVQSFPASSPNAGGSGQLR